MDQRRIDFILLVGIGVLLVVILVLALSAAPRSAAGDISDPVERVTAASELESEAVPAETPQAEVPATQDAVREQPATATAEPVAQEPAANAMSIGRIGFAYATGTAGACGVPLTAWNYIAVSRDLLGRYPCGTAVTLMLEDEIAGRTEVLAQVGDTMGADITDTVNIFVAEDEPALEYGVTSGTLSP
jgi:3D (Asp-Asp-Asp) domain-containing protein